MREWWGIGVYPLGQVARRWHGGVVALCVVEGVGLVATAVGWRMSSWLGDTGVLFLLAGLLDYCRSVSDRVVVYLV